MQLRNDSSARYFFSETFLTQCSNHTQT